MNFNINVWASSEKLNIHIHGWNKNINTFSNGHKENEAEGNLRLNQKAQQLLNFRVVSDFFEITKTKQALCAHVLMNHVCLKHKKKLGYVAYLISDLLKHQWFVRIREARFKIANDRSIVIC